MKAILLAGGLLAWSVVASHGQEVLDWLEDALSLASPGGAVRARLSGLLDLEGDGFEHPAPGLYDTTQQGFFAPRLSLFVDAQLGPQFYFFAQSRLDRGFDPGDRGAQFRLDEYALRFTPWQDGRLSVQIGRAATVFGTWVGRHLSWDNPFVNAPLPYENVTAASDKEPPASARGFGRVEADEKYEYVPVLWGPSYTTGLTVSGRADRFDYAAEIKNASLSSRPETWSALDDGFSHPSFNARLGFRPDLAWNLGVSASEGAYLLLEASGDLPRRRGVGDYRQYVFGQDVSYAAGRWQFWAECFESRFEVPRAGDLDAFSYYLEGKYKFMPQLFGALRWNQQAFAGAQGASARDTRRVDAAFTYRLTPHIQLKAQYSFQDGTALFGDGSTVYTQLTVRF